MQPVSINPQNFSASLQTIANASQQNDGGTIASNFTLSGTLTETFTLDLSSPTTANLAAVLGTLITIMQKGGAHRTT